MKTDPEIIKTQETKDKQIVEAVNTLIQEWRGDDTSFLNAWFASIAMAAIDEGMEYCGAQYAAAIFFERLDKQCGVKAREIANENIERYNLKNPPRVTSAHTDKIP